MSRKFDNLASACCGAGGGMGLSQAPAYAHAYLQRLGGHLDEARRSLRLVESGEWFRGLTGVDRQGVEVEMRARVFELEHSYQAISDATPLMQPVMMLRHADPEIAGRAWEYFTPAIPIDPPSLIYTGIGVVIALLIYELIKSPAALFKRKSPERHFDPN